MNSCEGNDPRKRNNAHNWIEREKKSKSSVFKLNEEYSLGQGRKVSLVPIYKISTALYHLGVCTIQGSWVNFICIPCKSIEIIFINYKAIVAGFFKFFIYSSSYY